MSSVVAERRIDLTEEIYQGHARLAGHLKNVIWEHHSHEETASNFDGSMFYASRSLLRAADRRDAARAFLRTRPRDEAD